MDWALRLFAIDTSSCRICVVALLPRSFRIGALNPFFINHCLSNIGLEGAGAYPSSYWQRQGTPWAGHRTVSLGMNDNDNYFITIIQDYALHTKPPKAHPLQKLHNT